MWLQSIRLRNFRNHLNSEFSFGEGVNVLLGNNGQGKTSVLEAISYLCLTKSFYASRDSVAVNHHQDAFEVEGLFRSASGVESPVRVAFEKTRGEKAFFLNRRNVEPLSSMLGKFPVVICSPEHAPITIGSPADRRSFVNLVMSQDSPLYYGSLVEYQKVLKHRNKILLDGKLGGKDVESVIEPWNDQLTAFGSEIVLRRRKFTEEFQVYLRSAYQQIAEGEEPNIGYQSFTAGTEENVNEVRERFIQQLREKRFEERRTGASLVGPHRDEFVFTVNDHDARKFASQGQHKTFLVALKLAEFFYLKERRQETPIMLLDDIFSELDEHRATRLIDFISSLGQTFLTSTYLHIFDRTIEFGETSRKFFIEQGSIAEHRTAPV